MVYLDKADNVNLLGLTDEPLQAELVECDSVADAYHRSSNNCISLPMSFKG